MHTYKLLCTPLTRMAHWNITVISLIYVFPHNRYIENLISSILDISSISRAQGWSLKTALGILMGVEIYVPKTDILLGLHLNLFKLGCSSNNFKLSSPAPIISGFTTKYDRRYRWLGQLVNARHNSRFVIGHHWPSQNDTEPLWVAWLADIKVSVADALT